MRNLAKEKKVRVADFAAVVAGTAPQAGKLVSADGVHLTSSGHKALAECFFLASEIKGPATIVCLGDSVTWGAGVKGSGTTTGETYPAYLSRIPIGDQ
jgi:lysophospholipase L1-like esterase